MSYLSLYRPQHRPSHGFDSDHDLSIRERRAARRASRNHDTYSGARAPRAHHSSDRYYYDEPPPEHYPEEVYDERVEQHHSNNAHDTSEVHPPEQHIPAGPLTTYIYSKCKHVEKCPSWKGGGGRFIKKGLCETCIASQAIRPPKPKSNVKLVRGEGGRLMYVREV